MLTEAKLNLWPGWKKILFRFFFIYFIFQINLVYWIPDLPLFRYAQTWYGEFMDWVITLGNKYIFHIRKELVPLNGSGDTSFGWAQLWMLLLLSAVCDIIWTLLDMRRKNYDRLAYWLRTFIRYFISLNALLYGIIKLFALQMPFPNLRAFYTLGRFSSDAP